MVLDSELLVVDFVAEEALKPVFLVVGDGVDVDDPFGARWHNSLPFQNTFSHTALLRKSWSLSGRRKRSAIIAN